MSCENSELCGIALIVLFIYWINEQYKAADDKHIAERHRRKQVESAKIKEEDKIILEKALLRKNKTIAEYTRTHHISLSCAQEIIEEILKEAIKAQSE
jgi:hypothetical protein